jgi:hypothetical protein
MHTQNRLLVAFGAGALCAALLPHVFLCLTGAALLLVTGHALIKQRKEYEI